DEESVSFEDERVIRVKAFMAIAEDEPSVGKADSRSGQWVEITMKKTSSKITLDQLLTEQVHGNIFYALGGRGKRKEQISPKEVLFTKPDESPIVTAPETTSGSEVKKILEKVSAIKAPKKRTQTVFDPNPKKKADPSIEQLLLTLMKKVKDLKRKSRFLQTPLHLYLNQNVLNLLKANKRPGFDPGSSSRKALMIPKPFKDCKYCGFNDHHSDEYEYNPRYPHHLVSRAVVLMVERNHREHLIRRFAGRGNKLDPCDVKIASLKQRIQELEFPKLQQESLIEKAETKSNVWDDGSEDVNPFGEGNPAFHDDYYDNPLTIVLVKEKSFHVNDTDNEEEESMPVYDTDIEDVIEEEEGFVGKGGFGREEDSIEDIVFVANNLCSSMIQNILSVDFKEDINTKSHELMSFRKNIIIKVSQSSFKVLICKKYQEWYLKALPMVDKLGFKTIKFRGISQNSSSPCTPKQNGVAEKGFKTLIEAARTMLNSVNLPKQFWGEAVNTACYTQNRSIIVKRHEKTDYDVFRERPPDISDFHVFGCPVHIHKHRDHLGKFDAKADDGFFLDYSLVAKAFRVFKIRRQEMEETDHVTFSKDDKAISKSSTEATDDHPFLNKHDDSESVEDLRIADDQVFIIRDPISKAEPSTTNVSPSAKVFYNPPILQDKWSKEKHIELVNIFGEPHAEVTTRSRIRDSEAASAHECIYVNFLSEIKPKRLIEALKKEGWIIARQEEPNQFERNKVYTLAPIPYGKTIIGTNEI
nr:retrovirus-related Pol polyprotein from transposon TNT 1-94 [Tanacetum cinerariifolium]